MKSLLSSPSNCSTLNQEVCFSTLWQNSCLGVEVSLGVVVTSLSSGRKKKKKKKSPVLSKGCSRAENIPDSLLPFSVWAYFMWAQANKIIHVSLWVWFRMQGRVWGQHTTWLFFICLFPYTGGKISLKHPPFYFGRCEKAEVLVCKSLWRGARFSALLRLCWQEVWKKRAPRNWLQLHHFALCLSVWVQVAQKLP